jgi:hypothetical protein
MFTRIYSSTCFERPDVHHQELNTLNKHHAPTVKPEAVAAAVVELMMMGVRTPETF